MKCSMSMRGLLPDRRAALAPSRRTGASNRGQLLEVMLTSDNFAVTDEPARSRPNNALDQLLLADAQQGAPQSDTTADVNINRIGEAFAGHSVGRFALSLHIVPRILMLCRARRSKGLCRMHAECRAGGNGSLCSYTRV